MNRELANTYNALAEAIESTIRDPGCEEDLALRLFELYVDLLVRIVRSRAHFAALAQSCGVALDSRPSTPQEGLEIFAALRAEYMSGWEREPVIIH